MKNRFANSCILFSLLIFLILVTSCVQVSEQTEKTNKTDTLCKAPYYEWKTGECCVDSNQNQICDNDEKTVEKEVTEPPVQTDKKTTTTKQESTPQINTQDMLEKALDQVVKITVNAGDETYIGSGFLVSPDGHILSNWHVFEPIFEAYCISKTSFSDCISILAELKDGRTFSSQKVELGATRTVAEITLVGGNKPHDIALLKIMPIANFDYFEFANSNNIKAGDTVFALGSPEGLDFSTSKGVISAKNRKGFNDESVTKYLQTDAAINKGNSGGPLIDEQGKIIGINTFMYKKDIAEGLNFALESNTAKEFYETLKLIKADIPGRICTFNEGIPDCTYPLITSPRLRSTPDAEIEVTKLDLNGISEADRIAKSRLPNQEASGTRLFSFTVAMKNNKEEPTDICFKLLAIDDGVKIYDKILEKRITLKPDVNLQEIIPVSDVQTFGDGYFEVNAIECNNPTKSYATGYARY